MYSMTSQFPDAAPCAVAGGAENDERTRDRVRAAVLEHGPVSAAQLGVLLKLTPAAVRRHLDTLARNGVIEIKRTSAAPAGAGRPARRYVLSKRGQSELGDDYLDIARTALEQLSATGGSAAIEAFAAQRFEKMERRYLPIVQQAGSDVAARAGALAAALNADGFAASAAAVHSAPAMSAEQLCQGHCPVQELAAEFPQFCAAETKVFSRLLGVDVRRLSTLARGGHVCTTHIPTGRTAAATITVEAGASTETDVSNHQQERP
ncbi:ArsR family transcriptional regulator [Paenarthrobacter sp. Z7-10]|uniref:helix-turn-helix transcriptional regulator n=1 Tax=Paenarthrobacter sp. Z7-10 TaxID=2787635 RepID=UPI0022A8ED94|nr:ArsR family transcriptional regulator [Paenarthrobacter sp. Z7-10]MCZ2402658.1 ArsR family transcriptional regulator [Paenarthrobacter sp. Z7-10]